MKLLQSPQDDNFLSYLRSQQQVQSYLKQEYFSIDQITELSADIYRISFKQCKKQIVLCAKPKEDNLISIQQFEREFLLTQQLYKMTNLPIPQPLFYCDDQNIIGTPFYCREFVEGRILKNELMSNTNQQDNKVFFQLATQMLGILHNINVQELKKEELQLFGAQQNCYPTLVKKLYNIYKLHETKISKHIEDLLYWLSLNDCQKQELDTCNLIHGDFSLSKLVFHPTELKIVAILGWKNASIGNAFLDIANFVSSYFIPFSNGNHIIEGWQDLEHFIEIPMFENILQIYTEARLSTKNLNLNYQIIMALLKQAIDLQVKFKLTKDLRYQENAEFISKAGYQFLLYITQDDPFQIRAKSIADGNLWSSWPVSDRCKSYYYRIKEFLKNEIIPVEKEILKQTQIIPTSNTNKGIPEVEALQRKAKSLGLWNLFISDPMYGKGLTNLEYVFLSELMGLSYLAHEIFNCFAPETGNIKLLIGFGSEYQKKKYLKPLLEGECKSFFAMTEKNVPSSDPNNFQFTITPTDGGFIVNGEKWFVSSAPDERATFGIVMGKSSQDTKNPMESQSMIIVDMPNPQIKILRQVSILGYYDLPHSYAEVHFENVFVPKENLLGPLGGAFKMAQGRLLGGRLHHCVRQVGLTRRCLDLMISLSQQSHLKLKDSDAFQDNLGRLEIAFQSCRLLTINAGLLMDSVGTKHLHTFMAVTQCKAHIPKACCQIVDECIQAFGEQGITDDQPLIVSYYFSRAIRLMDGPCELHLRQIARFAFGNHMFNELNNAQGYGISKL